MRPVDSRPAKSRWRNGQSVISNTCVLSTCCCRLSSTSKRGRGSQHIQNNAVLYKSTPTPPESNLHDLNTYYIILHIALSYIDLQSGPVFRFIFALRCAVSEISNDEHFSQNCRNFIGELCGIPPQSLMTSHRCHVFGALLQ
jgi:hypothetical protein